MPPSLPAHATAAPVEYIHVFLPQGITFLLGTYILPLSFFIVVFTTPEELRGPPGGGGIFNFPINLVGYFSQVPSMLVGSSQCCGRSHRFSLMRWEVG